MKMLWSGEPRWAPGLGLAIQPGEHEYPDAAVETLRAIGLTEAAEPPAPAKRKAAKTGEEE
jgi:hypothetical protein